MDPLFTGCDCRRWKFRKDKFALEGGERGGEGAAWLPANCSRAPSLPARRYVHRVCGHGRPGGFWVSQDPVLRWRRPIYRLMYGRQSAYSPKCEVSATTQTSHRKHHQIKIEQWYIYSFAWKLFSWCFDMCHFVPREAWVKEVPDYKPRLLIMNKYCLWLQWTYYLIGISSSLLFCHG